MGPKMTVSQIIDDLKTHTTTHSYEQLKDQIPLINAAFQYLNHNSDKTTKNSVSTSASRHLPSASNPPTGKKAPLKATFKSSLLQSSKSSHKITLHLHTSSPSSSPTRTSTCCIP